MAIRLIGTTNQGEIDSRGSHFTVDKREAIPAAGGEYSVAGGPTGIVAAGLAIDTTLMAMRFAPASARKAYVNRMRFVMSPATLGAAAGVAGSLALQRFSNATPTTGSSRIVNEMDPLSTATDMTDVRDSASALTVTSVTFGTIVSRGRIPLFVSSGGWYEWIFEPKYPVVLEAGDGLCLRTSVAMAATQTWVYDYTFYWREE